MLSSKNSQEEFYRKITNIQAVSAPQPSHIRTTNNRRKQYNAFIGYLYNLNLILGLGLMSIPYSFVKSGILYGSITLIVLAVCACITALWVLEIMGRTKALYYRNLAADTQRLTHENYESSEVSQNDDDNQEKIYSISIERKFELTEICFILFGRMGKIIFVVLISLYGLFALWSCATVVGTSWSTLIPISNYRNQNHPVELQQCTGNSFKVLYYPAEAGCNNLYKVCVAGFGCIVIILSLMELNEQKYIQALFTFLRFLAITAMFVFSLVIFIRNYFNSNTTTSTNITQSASNSTDYSQLTISFNFIGWIYILPVLVYAQDFHQGIPTLSHPVYPKRHLKPMIIANIITCTIAYLSLGIIVALAFGNEVNQNCTLNWTIFINSNNTGIAVKIVSYFILFFPSLTAISFYPIVVILLANNIYLIVMRKDTSQLGKKWRDYMSKLILRSLVSVVPVIGALFISNLVTILKFTGLFGFAMMFFLPICCQVQSKRLCKIAFENSTKSIADIEIMESEENQPNKESSPLIVKKSNTKLNLSLKGSVPTPYSGWYSNIFVIIVISIIALLFALFSFAGIGVLFTK